MQAGDECPWVQMAACEQAQAPAVIACPLRHLRCGIGTSSHRVTVRSEWVISCEAHIRHVVNAPGS